MKVSVWPKTLLQIKEKNIFMLWRFILYSICRQRPLLAVHRTPKRSFRAFSAWIFISVKQNSECFSGADQKKNIYLSHTFIRRCSKTSAFTQTDACSNKLYPPRLVLYFSFLYAVMRLYFCVKCNKESCQIFFYKTVTFRKQKASRMNQNSHFNQSDP